ncbi:UDP-glucose/GDP-mannose dehydrogenase family protein [Candidatus Woesebacteria bacterium]|nr:UDP-glucose/GDP-mannose dehydrogenase family protein [Candidatus Woesebacteria bacterium]
MAKKLSIMHPKIKKIGFIGLGKLGLPIAETIAKKGFNVLGYDIKETETSLPQANSIKSLVKNSELVFCAVQTPHNPLYEGDKPLPKTRVDFDYSFLIKAVKEVVAANKKVTLVVISTCLPGTYKRDIEPLLTNKINYLYNPFFIAMGTEIKDFLNPEFVLIGGKHPEILKDFYIKIHGSDKTFTTDVTTAEGIKVFYNTFITTKTVLGNMYGEYAHKIGMNVDDIYEALSRATDRIISPKYLRSGMSDGGGCHPRDNIALSFLADKIGLSFNFFDALMTAREKHNEWLASLFIEKIKTAKLPGIILGKSFKPETDLQTGSAAILLANILRKKRVAFEHYEFDLPQQLPVAVYFIATQHGIYRYINFPYGSVIIDPFRYLHEQSGVRIIRIGLNEENCGNKK